MNKRNIVFALLAVAFAGLIAAIATRKPADRSEQLTEFFTQQEEVDIRYGIPVDEYLHVEETIRSGENLSALLGRYGLTAQDVEKVVRAADGVFDIKTMKAGHTYQAFLSPDTEEQRLCHLVYERNAVEYVIFSFEDQVTVRTDKKEIRTERRAAEAEITSSLWNAMVSQGLNPSMAMDLSEIFAWSIDFFGLQKGDTFKVIYDEQFVDSLHVGYGDIIGAWFDHAGKRYYAIPFEQDGKITYWDENGNSLRQAMLKAPLNFTRISSTFSNSRLHPVLKIRRPHHGVDYAAPAGTPVYSVADGVVTERRYAGGGGNTVKIKHSQGLVTGYLHLQKYAPGLKVGDRVSQGQLIGYVGSTGLSTGPHLDFRVWKNGTPIDPLKVTSEPAEPIARENMAQFMEIKNRVVGALNGQLALEDIRLDAAPVPVMAATSQLLIKDL